MPEPSRLETGVTPTLMLDAERRHDPGHQHSDGSAVRGPDLSVEARV